MREIVETEDTGDIHVLASEETIPDSSVDLLLSGDDPSTNIADLQPDPVHAFRLWQLFLDRVNPLTKIIHAPTVQPYVMEAAANISSVPVRHQALLFSIYTMAIVSLSDHECLKLFDMSRDIALHRYTLGAKLSLIRFNFLRNYNMVTLQALILFLVSWTDDLFQHCLICDIYVPGTADTKHSALLKVDTTVTHLGSSVELSCELHRRWGIIVMAKFLISVLSKLRCGGEYGGGL